MDRVSFKTILLLFVPLADFCPDIAKATVAANRIIDMRATDQTDEGIEFLDASSLDSSDKGVRIELQNVWFSYPTRDVPILNGLDMTVSLDNISQPLPLNTDSKTD